MAMTQNAPMQRDRTARDMPTYDARAVTETGTQARILLDDQTYYLRITKAGKLILTK